MSVTIFVIVVGGLNLTVFHGSTTVGVEHEAMGVRAAQTFASPTSVRVSSRATIDTESGVVFSGSGGSSQVALNLLNGTDFVSPSLVYAGSNNNNVSQTGLLPELLTGNSTSQFWPRSSPVMLMAPASSTHYSGLFLYNASPGENVSVDSIGVGYPNVAGDGFEAYLFVQPVTTTSWGDPYFATNFGYIDGLGVHGLVILPYSESPYIVVQWDPYYNTVGGNSSPAFNLWLVTPQPNGTVAEANVGGFGSLGSTSGVTPQAGDYLSFNTSYSYQTNTVTAILRDENASGVNYSLDVNLTSHSFLPGEGSSGSYFFGAGASTGTIGPSGWGLLYNDFRSSSSPVTFTESGLPPGSEWSVNITGGGSHTSRTNTITFDEPVGSYRYAVSAAPGNAATPSSGTFTVAGMPLSFSVNFTAEPVYPVYFVAEGPLYCETWSVTLNGSTQGSQMPPCFSLEVQFSEPNGTYPFNVTAEMGYMASPSSGNVTVNGTSVVVTVNLSIVQNRVEFRETGLPTGKSWTAVLNGTAIRAAGASLTFTEPDGSYTYMIVGPAGREVSGVAASGTLVVSGSMTESFAFVKGPTRTLTFHEAGLARGQLWNVSLNGWSVSSGKPTIVFANLTPGTYTYSLQSPLSGQAVTAKSGAVGEPLNGTVSVTTKGQTIAYKFVYDYAITFTESGLPSGTNWSVKIGPETKSSATSVIVFEEKNGSYGYTVGSETGYAVSKAPGTLHVVGGPATAIVTFRLKGGAQPVSITRTSHEISVDPQRAVSSGVGGLLALWMTVWMIRGPRLR